MDAVRDRPLERSEALIDVEALQVGAADSRQKRRSAAGPPVSANPNQGRVDVRVGDAGDRRT